MHVKTRIVQQTKPFYFHLKQTFAGVDPLEFETEYPIPKTNQSAKSQSYEAIKYPLNKPITKITVPVSMTDRSSNFSKTLGSIKAESIDPKPNNPNAQVVACSDNLKVDCTKTTVFTITTALAEAMARFNANKAFKRGVLK